MAGYGTETLTMNGFDKTTLGSKKPIVCGSKISSSGCNHIMNGNDSYAVNGVISHENDVGALVNGVDRLENGMHGRINGMDELNNGIGNMSINSQDKMKKRREQELNGKDIADMIIGFQKSQVLYAASSLGMFEVLHRAKKPMCAEEVASKLNTHVDATERLMNACAGLKFLEKETAENKAIFRNSASTEKFLVRGSPFSMTSIISNVTDMYPLWGRLREGIIEGQCQISRALGVSGGYFEQGGGYYSTESKLLEFLRAMHIFSMMDSHQVIHAFDLTEFQRVCDLGGGTGALGVQMAKTHPHMDISVLDLEHVIACADQFFPHGIPSNVSFIAGDFFKTEFPPADLYILCHVIHDWGENKIDIILSKVYQSLPPGGALLVLEKTLSDEKDGPIDTLIFDIGMLIGCEGRERSLNEYRCLLKTHGFSDIQIKILPQAMWHDAILARKL